MNYKNVLLFIGFVVTTGICGLFLGRLSELLYFLPKVNGEGPGLILGVVTAVLFYWLMVRKFSGNEVIDKAKFITYGGVMGLVSGVICAAGVHGYLIWHTPGNNAQFIFVGMGHGLAPGVMLGGYCYRIFHRINTSAEQIIPKGETGNFILLKRLNTTSVILFILLFLFGIVISLTHATHHMNLDRCAFQLHRIGEGVLFYQQQNKGTNPPNLKVLLGDEYETSPRSLACPISGDDYEKGDVSYVYRGDDLNKDASAEMVLTHDRLRNHERYDWVNALHADGEVKPYSREEFRKMIERDNELRRELGLIEKNIEGNKK